MEKQNDEMWLKMESLFQKYKNQPTPPEKLKEKSGSGNSHSGHKNHKEMIECPNCWKEVGPLAEAKLKLESHPPKSKYVCKNCKGDVKLSQEKCTTCGSTEAKER